MKIIWRRPIEHLAFVRERVTRCNDIDREPARYWWVDCEVVGYSVADVGDTEQKTYYLLRPRDTAYVDGFGPEVAKDWRGGRIVDPTTCQPPKRWKASTADERAVAQRVRDYWANRSPSRGHQFELEQPQKKRFWEFWK